MYVASNVCVCGGGDQQSGYSQRLLQDDLVIESNTKGISQEKHLQNLHMTEGVDLYLRAIYTIYNHI